MSHCLRVHPLPSCVAPAELAGATAIVIDVLRASTTIVHALARGAREVIACREVEEARAIAAALPPEETLLGGERLGLPIEGFDLGNSPAAYTGGRVAGKTIVFTTTNGTQALVHARDAAKVLVAGFVNAQAVAERVRCDDRIEILCAGTRGEPTEEDLLLAGLLATRLTCPSHAGEREMNAHAQQAIAACRAVFAADPRHDWPAGRERLIEALRQSRGGRNVLSIGLDEDIVAAAELDRFTLVPALRRVCDGPTRCHVGRLD